MAKKASKEQSRALILEAATRILAERGSDVGFAEIAEAAGVSRTLVYFHFKDRAGLIQAARLRAVGLLGDRFAEVSSGGESGLDRIEAIGRAYYAFGKDHPAEFQILVISEPPSDPKAKQAEMAPIELMVKVLREGIRDGSIRKNLGDPKATSVCLWGFTHGLSMLAAGKGGDFEREMGITPKSLMDFGFSLMRASLKKS
jgi:AcrR family transcriptional regulator